MSNFNDYEPPRMREMPKDEVHIVTSGIGEPGAPSVAPAIANAIFPAIGERLCSLSFDLKSMA